MSRSSSEKRFKKVVWKAKRSKNCRTRASAIAGNPAQAVITQTGFFRQQHSLLLDAYAWDVAFSASSRTATILSQPAWTPTFPTSPKDGAQHNRHAQRPRHAFVVPHVVALPAPRTATVSSEVPPSLHDERARPRADRPTSARRRGANLHFRSGYDLHESARGQCCSGRKTETWWKCRQRRTASSARCHTASNQNLRWVLRLLLIVITRCRHGVNVRSGVKWGCPRMGHLTSGLREWATLESLDGIRPEPSQCGKGEVSVPNATSCSITIAAVNSFWPI
ncbi:hypothetical protein B0H13DRAFT_2443418 [Mycena leptocephala]|nr:hypothetical protein B0H13DRAFT_2443418 [Mycena leptocephala]